MKLKNLTQRATQIAAQFVANHVGCCGAQWAVGGLQFAVTGVAATGLQALPYMTAPVTAALCAYIFQSYQGPAHHGDCSENCHVAIRSQARHENFLFNTGVNLLTAAGMALLGVSIGAGENDAHPPQGPVVGILRADHDKAIVSFYDDTKILFGRHRYFETKGLVALNPDDQSIKAPVHEISIVNSIWQQINAGPEGQHITGDLHIKQKSKRGMLLLRIAKDDRHAMLARETGHEELMLYAQIEDQHPLKAPCKKVSALDVR